MSYVSKAKLFDVNKVVVSTPVNVIDKNYVLKLHYLKNGQELPLRVQIPRTSVYNSLYETNGKFYIDLIMRMEGTFHNFHKCITGIANTIQSKHTKFSHCEVISSLKRVHDEAYSVRVKVPRNGSNFQCKIWASNNKEITPNTIASGDDVVCILEVDCVFICDNTITFNMLLNELKLAS